jgi:hypothetical protein
LLLSRFAFKFGAIIHFYVAYQLLINKYLHQRNYGVHVVPVAKSLTF